MPYTEPSANEQAAIYEGMITYTAATSGQPIPITLRLVASTDDIRYDPAECDAAFQALLNLIDSSPDFAVPYAATKHFDTVQQVTPTGPEG